MSHISSIDQAEINHFSQDSASWWDENGPFRPLHMLNPVRLHYIRDRITEHFGRDSESMDPLKSLKILDIGCGGGLVSESVARMGARVTAVDADAQAIAVAIDHAKPQGLAIDYRNEPAEALLPENKGAFDVVMALEIVEHVVDRDSFIASCAALCKPGGMVILSTLNRTAKSYALGIIAAEHILRWVPHGTHDWKKFVKPSELAHSARRVGLNPSDLTGYHYNPLTGQFGLSTKDVSVNYFMTVEKIK